MHISTQKNTIGYLGSKFTLLPWLLPKLKQAPRWLDLFGGSFVVTINRPAAEIETYNDINGQVVNFFKQLRDNTSELMLRLELTPHSRFEYEHAWDTEGDDDVERARKFFVRVRQSFLCTGSGSEVKGWNSDKQQSRGSISGATRKLLNSVEGLWEIAERIRRVQLENRSYDWVLDKYDTPETMIYADPPYDGELRSSSSDYAHDFTNEDHVILATLASSVKGYIAVSGYNSDFMKELYKDFYYSEGPQRKNNYSKKKNVRECLWTNYDPYNCNNANTLFQ